MPIFKNGFILDPERFWSPCYRISPFNTSYVAANQNIIKKGLIDNDILGSYFGDKYVFCRSGKHAISMALSFYKLKPEDEIWIVTTTGNKYISSCVTNEIERFCHWSRTKSERTKLIFLNHEFGFCYPDPEELKSHGVPIIEDKALSFASDNAKGNAGKIGDFCIYSLPKFFPVNFGGILTCNLAANKFPFGNLKEQPEGLYLKSLLTRYLPDVTSIAEKRRENYELLAKLFETAGCYPRFKLNVNDVPGVFMFKAVGVNLAGLKMFMQNNGVEASVFYGEDAFFIPVHQNLSIEDLNFFFTLYSHFIDHGNQ